MVAEIPHSAVPTALLTEILLWKDEGCSEMDVIERLRLRTIPDGYHYHTWNYGIIMTCTCTCTHVINMYYVYVCAVTE